MAVKFGKAFGLKVTVFSTSESKRAQAIDLLGADNFVLSSDKQQMEVSVKFSYVLLRFSCTIFGWSRLGLCSLIENNIFLR